MLDLVWLGIAAAPQPDRMPSMPIIPGSTLRRGSPASSALNSPGFGSTLGLGFEQHRSSSLGRGSNSLLPTSNEASPVVTPSRPAPPPLNRAATVAATSPTASITATMRPSSPPRPDRVQSPRWTRCFIPLCVFLETLINETPIPNDLFNRIITLICLAFGQDDSDMMQEEAWEGADQVLSAALGPNGGRRGELAIRTILEGKTVTISNNRSLKMPEEDRKIARGAVM
jgi:hypothetical protein